MKILKSTNFTKIIFSFTFFLVLNSYFVLAQEKSVWKILEGVRFETRKEGDYQIDVPVFNKEVKALDGKIVKLHGYVLPLELNGKNKFMFSALPYNSCYFCGGAGPETVMEVKASKPIPYQAKLVTIQGKLTLNDSDFNHLMYMLSEAVQVNE